MSEFQQNNLTGSMNVIENFNRTHATIVFVALCVIFCIFAIRILHNGWKKFMGNFGSWFESSWFSARPGSPADVKFQQLEGELTDIKKLLRDLVATQSTIVQNAENSLTTVSLTTVDTMEQCLERVVDQGTDRLEESGRALLKTAVDESTLLVRTSLADIIKHSNQWKDLVTSLFQAINVLALGSVAVAIYTIVDSFFRKNRKDKLESTKTKLISVLEVATLTVVPPLFVWLGVKKGSGLWRVISSQIMTAITALSGLSTIMGWFNVGDGDPIDGYLQSAVNFLRSFLMRVKFIPKAEVPPPSAIEYVPTALDFNIVMSDDDEKEFSESDDPILDLDVEVPDISVLEKPYPTGADRIVIKNILQSTDKYCFTGEQLVFIRDFKTRYKAKWNSPKDVQTHANLAKSWTEIEVENKKEVFTIFSYLNNPVTYVIVVCLTVFISAFIYFRKRRPISQLEKAQGEPKPMFDPEFSFISVEQKQETQDATLEASVNELELGQLFAICEDAERVYTQIYEFEVNRQAGADRKAARMGDTRSREQSLSLFSNPQLTLRKRRDPVHKINDDGRPVRIKDWTYYDGKTGFKVPQPISQRYFTMTSDPIRKTPTGGPWYHYNIKPELEEEYKSLLGPDGKLKSTFHNISEEEFKEKLKNIDQIVAKYNTAKQQSINDKMQRVLNEKKTEKKIEFYEDDERFKDEAEKFYSKSPFRQGPENNFHEFILEFSPRDVEVKHFTSGKAHMSQFEWVNFKLAFKHFLKSEPNLNDYPPEIIQMAFYMNPVIADKYLNRFSDKPECCPDTSRMFYDCGYCSSVLRFEGLYGCGDVICLHDKTCDFVSVPEQYIQPDHIVGCGEYDQIEDSYFGQLFRAYQRIRNSAANFLKLESTLCPKQQMGKVCSRDVNCNFVHRLYRAKKSTLPTKVGDVFQTILPNSPIISVDKARASTCRVFTHEGKFMYNGSLLYNKIIIDQHGPGMHNLTPDSLLTILCGDKKWVVKVREFKVLYTTAMDNLLCYQIAESIKTQLTMSPPEEGAKATLLCYSSGDEDSFISASGAIEKIGDQFRYTCSSDYGYCTGGVYSNNSHLVGWHVAGGDKDNVFIPVTSDIISALQQPIRKLKPIVVGKNYWESEQPKTPKSGKRKPNLVKGPFFRKVVVNEGKGDEITFFLAGNHQIKEYCSSDLFKNYRYDIPKAEYTLFFQSPFDRDYYAKTKDDQFYDGRSGVVKSLNIPLSAKPESSSVVFANPDFVRSILKKDNDDVKYQSQNHLNSLAPKADGAL